MKVASRISHGLEGGARTLAGEARFVPHFTTSFDFFRLVDALAARAALGRPAEPRRHDPDISAPTPWWPAVVTGDPCGDEEDGAVYPPCM